MNKKSPTGPCTATGREPRLQNRVLTYWAAVEDDLLQVASVVVQGQVPGSGVHVLDEARFLEAVQQQTFRSFDVQDGISQGSGQRLPIQQFDKVELTRSR